MSSYNIEDYGAIGDGKANCAVAIQKAIDQCAAGGGGRVWVPAGKTYMAGTLTLKSNVELYIERGATPSFSHSLCCGATARSKNLRATSRKASWSGPKISRVSIVMDLSPGVLE